MTGRFEGKHVLVTGASRGIGRAVALAFAEEGGRVSVLARTEQELFDRVVTDWERARLFERG